MVLPGNYSAYDTDLYQNQGLKFMPLEMYSGTKYKAPGSGDVENDTFRQPTGIGTVIPFNRNDDNQTALERTYLTEPGDLSNYRRDQLLGTPDYFPPETKFQGVMENLKNKFFPGRIKGQLGDRLQGQFDASQNLPSIFAALAGMQSPFNPASKNYNPNIGSQLNFLEGSDDFLIGRDPNTGGLKYGPDSVLRGKNVISGFGTNNYQTALMNYIAKMQKSKASQELKDKRIKQAEEELTNLQTQSDKGLGRDKDRGGFDPSGPTQRSIRAEREDKSGKGQSGGFTNPGAESYGPHMADGGRVQYMMGGLTDLVDIYD